MNCCRNVGLLLFLWAGLTALAQEQAVAPDAMLANARAVYDEQGPKPALPLFEAAVKAYQASANRRGEAIAIGWIGNCYKHLGDMDRALKSLEQSLAIKRELNDPVEQAKTLNNIGLLFWEEAKYPEAIASYQQAISLAYGAHDARIEGAVLNNLALVYSNRGRYHEAFAQYERALSLHRDSHFYRGESDALGNIGGLHFDLGHYRQALDYYEQSNRAAERAGLKPSLMQNLGNMGLIYTALGRVPDALEAFDRAAALAAEQGLKREQADWYKGKGSALAQIGKFDAALQQFHQASRLYDEASSARQQVEVFNDLGDLYLSLGDLASAEKHYRSALQEAANLSYTQGGEKASFSLADIERRRGQLDMARKTLNACLLRAQAAGDDATAAETLLQLAVLNRQQSRVRQSDSNAAQALEIAHRVRAPLLEARALRERGEAALAGGDRAAALALLRQAEALPVQDSELKWTIAYAEGRALEGLRDYAQAVQAYRRAVDEIESVRDELREDRFRSGYLQSRYDVYVALVRLLIQLHRLDEALSYSERLRTRSFLQTLSRESVSQDGDEIAEVRARIRKLEAQISSEQSKPGNERREAVAYYSDELAKAETRYQELMDDLQSRAGSRKPATVLSASQIRETLGHDSAILEYVVGAASTSLLCLTSRSLHGTSIPVSSAELTSKIELLRDLISDPRRDDWRAAAASLYQQLVAPAVNAGWLSGVRRIYVVPHGVLHYLPFGVLQASVTSPPLISNYTLQYMPGASFISAHSDGPPGALRALSMAPAEARLPFAEQEARSVAQLFQPGSLAVVGRTATKNKFVQAAADFDVLHLATHGYFNRLNPMFSGVQLQPDGGGDGTLRVYEILSLRLKARLVTLSACETALGSGFFADLPAGDEFVGLTRAFLGAGGKSVLASLWQVSDRSTVQLMLNFYRQAKTHDTGVALTLAQRAMASQPTYQHPYYWASFILTGAR